MLVHILIALGVAFFLTALVAIAMRKRDPFPSLVTFFLVVFLATWAVGVWAAPVGPSLWGAAWLPFVMAGMVFALLLAALWPASRDDSTVEIVDPQKEQRRRRIADLALSGAMWALLALLAITIAARYLVV